MHSNSNTSWWKGAVIYQIYPRSYNDSNNDGIGDLPGITEKLPYIASLNVDAIWISPFFVSPMKDFGYDVKDYREVDPIFGTLSDFKKLLEVAHDLNLKVVIDQVISHSSDQHPWFIESRQNRTNPKADWYVWADAKEDGTPPTNWQSVFGGTSWEWDARREQYYLHNFLQSQPDLNFHNPEVRKQMLEEMRFWLSLGVDGFRLDTVNYYFHDQELRDNPPTLERPEKIVNPYYCQQHLFDKNRPENVVFLSDINKLAEEFPGTMMLGEIGDIAAEKMLGEYTAPGRLQTAYSFTLLTEEFGASHFADVINRQEAELGSGWPTWAFSNHDVKRVISRWPICIDDEHKLAQLYLAFLTSLKGGICLYQGEELGLGEADVPFELLQDPWGITFWPEFKGRDGCRTPMPWHKAQVNAGFSSVQPWLPVSECHKEKSVHQQQQSDSSILAFCRDILAFRQRTPALMTGDLESANADSDVLFINRVANNSNVFCYFNFSTEEKTVFPPAETVLHKSSDDTEYSSGSLTIPALGFAFLQSTD